MGYWGYNMEKYLKGFYFDSKNYGTTHTKTSKGLVLV